MKSFNVFIVSALLLLISFLGVGYASLTDTLTVGADVSATWIEPSILYTSSASVTSGNAGATSLRYRLGSEDVANPAAHLFTTLDFTGTDTIEITLSIKNNFKVGDLEDTFVFKELQVQIGTGELVSINSEAIQTTPRGVDSTSLEEFNISYDGIDAEIRKANDNRDGDGIEASTVRSGITLTLTKTASTPSSVSANFMFKFGYTSPEVVVNSAANALLGALNDKTPDENGQTTLDKIESAMKEQGSIFGGSYKTSDDYVGNVAGSGTTDSSLIEEVFGETLNYVIGEEGKECTVMIKQKDIVNYNDITNTDEMILYITPDTITGTTGRFGSSSTVTVTVYAIVYVKDSSGTWSQYGDMYKGKANTNTYYATISSGVECDSFNTETWAHSGEATYGGDNGYTISDKATINSIMTTYTNWLEENNN